MREFLFNGIFVVAISCVPEFNLLKERALPWESFTNPRIPENINLFLLNTCDMLVLFLAH
jgi:hypothetical protein